MTVGEVCTGYFKDVEEGVIGYDDCLDVRPKYQKEFVYRDSPSNKDMCTVLKGLLLNVIYWRKVKKDGIASFEYLDGQQCTISLCKYIDDLSLSMTNSSAFSLLT